MHPRLLTGLGLLTGGVLYARYIEPSWIQTKTVRLTLPRLDRAFHNYTIAQISDLHFDDWLTRERLERAVERINRRQPDLIVITGDFISNGIMKTADDLIAGLRGLSAPDGVLAVLGNHDYYRKNAAIAPLRRAIQAAGVQELHNAVHTIERRGKTLHICGVDDMIARQSRLDLVLKALPEDGAAILLAHEPDFADISAATGRFDLQLSGHTHGGQVRLPPFSTLAHPRYGRRYVIGLQKVAGMTVYVNRGLGMVGVPLRFNARPEITLFRLKAPC